MTDSPYRLVDRFNQGWVITGGGDYQPGGHHPELGNHSLAELTEQRGPCRPVLPVTDDDEELLHDAFRRAGRKTIATLAAALEQVFHTLREREGGLRNPGGSYEAARRTMTAGREGSWESEVLISAIIFGNGLNLLPPKRGFQNVHERRAAGPKSRVNRDVRDALADILLRWVTGPDRYTEVAETLAAVVSRYADETAYGREDVKVADDPDAMLGWKSVADQHLQPGTPADADFVTCYRLFYSQSAHFNSHLI